MRIVVYHHQSHADPWLVAFEKGLTQHGQLYHVRLSGDLTQADLAVFWGVSANRKAIEFQKKSGGRYLVVERAYVLNRFNYASLGLDGLNGRALFPKACGRSDRLEKLVAAGLVIVGDRPVNPGGNILVVGQVPGDAALDILERSGGFASWAAAMCEKASKFGKVLYRPHPDATRRGLDQPPARFEKSLVNHEMCMRDARVVVTFNSNFGVDAALCGVPIITCDDGAMARRVSQDGLGTSIDVRPPYEFPGYEEWLKDLSYSQWLMDEVSSGLAWDELKTLLNAGGK